MMNRVFSPANKQRGFSLIDAMIATVVLAVGLLALAALQANISRNTADSRARSQVTAFVEEIIERQRTYGVNASFAAVPLATLWTTAEVTAVQNNAGVSNLAVSLASTHFDGRTGTFITPVAVGLLSADPQYKVLRSVATWVDASGQGRRVDLTSVLSPRITSSSSVPFNVGTGGSGSSAARPQKNPLVSEVGQEGMVPIAISGSGNSGVETASTNPKPLIATGRNRTTFDVITYQRLGANATTVLQKQKVENAIVNCQCSANAAPTGVQFATPRWPARWDGYSYKIYTPLVATNAPGVGKTTGPKASVTTQDQLCTECCRDHHDIANNTTHVKFDPFRSDAHEHYKMVSGTLVKATGADDYLESCRMVIIDGFWRTAQDLDMKHFDLLKTQANATDHTPDDTAVANYQTFAKKFLKTNYVPNETALSAISIYAENSLQLDQPANITIPRYLTTADNRYLHSRGLYVDYVDSNLQTLIQKAFDDCTVNNKEECVLPLLSFTSINLTEAAYYTPSNPSSGALAVTSNGFVEYTPNAPGRGRVSALTTAANGTAYISPTMLKSNSGLAVSLTGVDPEDNIADNDSDNNQKFTIGTGSPSVGDAYTVNVTWPDGTPSGVAPSVAWLSSTSGDDCKGTGFPLTCTTNVTLPQIIATTIGNYNYPSKTSTEWAAYSGPITCTKTNGQPNPVTFSSVVIAAGTAKSRPVCKVFAASISNVGFTASYPGSLYTAKTIFTNTVNKNDVLSISLDDTDAADMPATDVSGQGYTCKYSGSAPNSITGAVLTWDSDPCTPTTFGP